MASSFGADGSGSDKHPIPPSDQLPAAISISQLLDRDETVGSVPRLGPRCW